MLASAPEGPPSRSWSSFSSQVSTGAPVTPRGGLRLWFILQVSPAAPAAHDVDNAGLGCPSSHKYRRNHQLHQLNIMVD
jgi:hypothetical protein